MRSFVAILVTTVLFGGGMLPTASAQTPANRGDQRRDLVDGILRTLIESQLNRPGQPGVRTPRPGQPTAESPQMAEIRRSLQGFSQDSVGLIAALRNEERYSPAIRPLLGDAITIKAAADVLLQKSQYVRDQKLLMQDFQELDRQWRFLSHRLEQVPNLGAPCKSYIARLDAYDQQLCRYLQITPQLDLNALMNRTMALVTHLENLQQDISIDLRGASQQDQLLAEARALDVQLHQLADVISRNAPRDEVVARFTQIYEQWRDFAAKLRGADSESLARDIFRIEQIKGEIHQLLWLEQQVDPVALVHLTKHLEQSVAKMYGFIPLATILSTPRPDQAAASAKEFYDLCRNLAVSAGKKDGLEGMRWDFRLLEVEWQQVRGFIEPLSINGMDQMLARVDWAVDALRAALQIPAVLDQQAAIDLAASIDELAVSMDQDLRRRVGTSVQYTPQLRAQLLARSQSFHDASHRLHESVARGGQQDQLRKYCTDVAESWSQLAAYLGQLNETDRYALGQTYQAIVPQVGKLQILLAY